MQGDILNEITIRPALNGYIIHVYKTEPEETYIAGGATGATKTIEEILKRFEM